MGSCVLELESNSSGKADEIGISHKRKWDVKEQSLIHNEAEKEERWHKEAARRAGEQHKGVQSQPRLDPLLEVGQAPPRGEDPQTAQTTARADNPLVDKKSCSSIERQIQSERVG